MRSSRFAFLLVAGILAAGGRARAANAKLTAPEERPPAPGFALESVSGREIHLDDHRGEVVVLNFWATWCHGCKLELPWFVQFEKQYGSRGLTVVGASTDADGWKTVRPFLAKKRLNYPVVIADESLTKAYGLGAMPMTVLIDRRGRIAAMYQGVVDRAACNQAIQSLLLESAGP
jgi:cytochrome c biogenesis protein CcmG/thiol:disulfide interchange protein DsbE